MSLITNEQLRQHGTIDLIIARSQCQGLSMVGHHNGLLDKRGAIFVDLMHIIQLVQMGQEVPSSYIIENVPIATRAWEQSLLSIEWVQTTLNLHAFVDTAKIGSRANRPCMQWTNLVPITLQQSAYEITTHLHPYFVHDILHPHWTPQHVQRVEKPPYVVVNKLG